MVVYEKLETKSTNDDAKALADDGAPHLAVVWAHKQYGGRGRHGSSWISTQGNVFWSILVRPASSWRRFQDIAFLSALAVCNTIQSVCGDNQQVEIKWPNDILIADRKVAGILIEAGGTFTSHMPDWIVVGVGINVTSHPENVQVAYPPTSLHALGYASAERRHLMGLLYKNFVNELDEWTINGFESARRRYEAAAHRFGQMVTVSRSASKQDYAVGIYRGITPDGEMIVEDSAGVEILISSGDIVARQI